MANFATSRLFTIFLLLLAANAAYGHRSTILADSCEDEIKNNDFSDCKNFISGKGLPIDCCRQLGAVPYTCVCDALKNVLKETDGGTDEIGRAYTLFPYCRLGTPAGCDLGAHTAASK